jgi:hypothetical protein
MEKQRHHSIVLRLLILLCHWLAKTGTEAVAELFYHVVEKQEMDGEQGHEVLVNRSKVDWSLPPVIQCEPALTEMAQLYIDGDKARGLKRHHMPIYKDKW